MRFRTWPVAALALGGMLLLAILSVQAASSRAQKIYILVDQLNLHHRTVETKLRQLRSDVHLSGIFIRDYLLDPDRAHASDYRARLAEYRRNNITTVTELRALMRGQPDDDRLVRLDAKLEEYWQAFDPLFDWTPAEKAILSSGFLRREVLPRREAVLSIASEIEELNNANHAIQRAEVTRQYAIFRADLHKLLWGSLLLGLIVALTAVIRLRILERRSEDQRTVARDAEDQMRKLSQQLVATQEEERKNLSRELHDHVGQVLTALRMELGRIDRLRLAADRPRHLSDGRIAEAVAECRSLVDSVVRTVRDLALGLRPSMLDDFGLQPALEWHLRDFERRYGVPVELTVEGDFAWVPDQHRTCVYRVVQEALTNCIRHARAAKLSVRIKGQPDLLTVSVSDDGVGMTSEKGRTGFGLRGIEERVRELHGTLVIHTATGAGTRLTIELPVPRDRAEETPRARAAG
jgi:signal transduction histidine kinase